MTTHPSFLPLALAAYFLGCSSLARIIARSLGVDLATCGSGGIGATNLFRALKEHSRSTRFSSTGAAFIWDLLKGLLPVLLAQRLSFFPGETLVVAALVVLGHTFPLGGKGGKAVATGLGILLALQPILALICLAIFLLGFVPTGIVAVGSVLAAAVLVVLSPLMMGNLTYALTGVLLGIAVALLHKKNILRILRDEEKPLFHWRLGLRKFPENARHCLFFIHVPGDTAEACKEAAVNRIWWAKFLPASWIQRAMPHMPKWMSYMGHSKGITMLNGQPIICHSVGVPYEMSAFVDPKHPHYEVAFGHMLVLTDYFLNLIPEIGVVGQGAGTGITHRNGHDYLRQTRIKHPKLKVTNGNTFTEVAATLTEARLQQTVDTNRLRRGEAEVKAVVGAGGSVGRKVAEQQLRNPDCSELLVVGNPEKENGGLDRFLPDWQAINPEKPVRIVSLNEATREASTLFLCTNASGGLAFDPAHCRKRLKIVDVGKPANSPKNLKEILPDAILVAGGHVKLPGKGMGMGKIIGLFGHVVFACCAETIIHATGLTAMWRDATEDAYVGSPNPVYAEELRNLAAQLGITVDSFYDPHTDSEITFTR